MKPTIVLISSPRGHFSPINSGAISTWLYEVAREAQKDGFAPVVVARRAPQPPYAGIDARFVDFPDEPQAGFALRRARLARKITGWPHFGQARYAARLAALLQRDDLHRHPLVISNDPELAVYLRARFPGALIAHHFHNQQTVNPRWKARFQVANPRIGAVSDFTRRFLAQEYGFDMEAMRTIYNGVDAAQFAPRAAENVGETPILNFVGRTGIEKGADLLLDAALLLADEKNLAFGVQIVGANTWSGTVPTNYQEKLLALAASLEARGVSVRQTGHVQRTEIAAQFRRAHIHVVPSRWDEPFGLTTVEGMASGLATVASNTGGSPEIIADSGWLFERDNAADLALKLRPLLENPDLRREYGRKARERALDFSWQNTWSGVRGLVEC